MIEQGISFDVDELEAIGGVKFDKNDVGRISSSANMFIEFAKKKRTGELPTRGQIKAHGEKLIAAAKKLNALLADETPAGVGVNKMTASYFLCDPLNEFILRAEDQMDFHNRRINSNGGRQGDLVSRCRKETIYLAVKFWLQGGGDPVTGNRLNSWPGGEEKGPLLELCEHIFSKTKAGAGSEAPSLRTLHRDIGDQINFIQDHVLVSD